MNRAGGIRHYSSLRSPTAYSGSLVLRAPPPVTVAFARPCSPDMPPRRSIPPRCRGGQSKGIDGRAGRPARPATLGFSRPVQAAMWGVPGQLAAGRPRFIACLGSASLSNINIHWSSRTHSYSFDDPPLLGLQPARSPYVQHHDRP